MFLVNLCLFLVVVVSFFIVRRMLWTTSFGFFLQSKWRVLEEFFHAHQLYKIPKYNQHMQQNQVYHKVLTYLNSLPSAEDSDFVTLFSGNNKPNEINLLIDADQMFVDTFLGSRIFWKFDKDCLVLKIRRREKRRILSSYIQHIHKIADEIEQKTKDVKLYINSENEPEKNGRWISVPFTHPATIDTAAIDSDLKNKVKSDLESFLKSKQYYHRLGRVWKRSYLLHGPSGTGKSSFIAGMAKFLSYDIYDVDLSKVAGDSDLKLLLLQTTKKSMIIVEDLDRYLVEKSTAVSLSGILNFMDGIISCCGEERVMVFTARNKDQVDPTVIRPGRIDVDIYFPSCDFPAFKSLAQSHLGIKEHKLFPQVEEIFQSGATLSPAEVGEIMVSNRGSPTRALKTVITALQTNSNVKTINENTDVSHKMIRDGSVDGLVGLPPRSRSVRTVEETDDQSGLFSRENIPTVKEFKKLYGFLRNKSKRESIDLDGEGRLST